MQNTLAGILLVKWRSTCLVGRRKAKEEEAGANWTKQKAKTYDWALILNNWEGMKKKE